jgi:4,5-DOPA dioxygenase extradiol
VVQLSIDGMQPPRVHYELGRKLAPLRDEGVLVIGSGNVVHNLRVLNRRDDAPAFDWAVRFNDRVRDALARRDHDALVDYAAGGEDAALSVPTPEHYLPLLYVAALQAEDEPMSFPVDGIDKGSLGMLTTAAGV